MDEANQNDGWTKIGLDISHGNYGSGIEVLQPTK